MDFWFVISVMRPSVMPWGLWCALLLDLALSSINGLPSVLLSSASNSSSSSQAAILLVTHKRAYDIH